MQGKISQGHAKMLVSLDKNEQKVVIDTILGQKLTVRDTEKLIQKVKKHENTNETQDENVQKELDKLKKRLNKLDIAYKVKNTQITLNLSDVDKIKQLNNLLQ